MPSAVSEASSNTSLFCPAFIYTLVPSERLSIEEMPRAAADSRTVGKASSSAVVSSLAVVQVNPSR